MKMIKNGDRQTESYHEVEIFLNELKVALDNKCYISVIEQKTSEISRAIERTNAATIAVLFPNEEPHKALRRELKKLRIKHYMYSMIDDFYPLGNKLKVFGMSYSGNDVYIKLKLEFETDKSYENAVVLVLSFHYSTRRFGTGEFPYEVKK